MAITNKNLNFFEKCYLKAVKEGKKSFMFNNKPIQTAYAKYLIEYIHSTFDEREKLKEHENMVNK